MTIEFHVLPPRRAVGGQQCGDTSSGVLAIDTETGIAVAVVSERSQIRNKREAERRLREILEMVAQRT